MHGCSNDIVKPMAGTFPRHVIVIVIVVVIIIGIIGIMVVIGIIIIIVIVTCGPVMPQVPLEGTEGGCTAEGDPPHVVRDGQLGLCGRMDVAVHKV
jgi:hypothetical protein